VNSKMFEYMTRTWGYKLSGLLHSPKDQIGDVFVNPDGEQFVIFKQTVLDPASGLQRKPEAMFRVQFQVPKIKAGRDRFIISIRSPIFVLPRVCNNRMMDNSRSARIVFPQF
jgi:hypothetical protein